MGQSSKGSGNAHCTGNLGRGFALSPLSKGLATRSWLGIALIATPTLAAAQGAVAAGTPAPAAKLDRVEIIGTSWRDKHRLNPDDQPPASTTPPRKGRKSS